MAISIIQTASPAGSAYVTFPAAAARTAILTNRTSAPLEYRINGGTPVRLSALGQARLDLVASIAEVSLRRCDQSGIRVEAAIEYSAELDDSLEPSSSRDIAAASTTAHDRNPAAHGLMRGHLSSKIVFCGDSLTAACLVSTATTESYSGFIGEALSSCGVRVVPEVQAVVGISAVTYSTSAYLQNAIASDAEVAVVLLGHNDVSNTTANFATSIEAIWSALIASGKRVIACTLHPRNYAGDTPGMRAQVSKINAYIRQRASASDSAITLCDLYPALVNIADGMPATGATADGLHLSVAGSAIAGRVVGAAIAKCVSATNATEFTALADADAFRGTSNGFASGDVAGLATNWNVLNPTGGTIVSQKVARSDYIPGGIQEVDVQVVPTVTVAEVASFTSAVIAAVGSKIVGVIDCEFVSGDGYGAIATSLHISAKTSGYSTLKAKNIYFSGKYQFGKRLRLITPEFTIPETTGVLQISLGIRGVSKVRIHSMQAVYTELAT